MKDQEQEYPLFPELTEEGKKQAQDLMIKFDKLLVERAKDLMETITNDFYYDIANEVEGDHWTNYRNKLLDGLCNYDNKSHSKHDFDKIRKAIYKNHKEEIVKDLNQDLLEEVKDLKKKLEDAYLSRFR